MGAFAVQQHRDSGAKCIAFQLLLTSKRPFAYKQKAIQLQANDHLLTSKSSLLCSHKE